MQINEDGLEELYRGLYKECIETIAFVMCSSLSDEDKAIKVEDILYNYQVIK